MYIKFSENFANSAVPLNIFGISICDIYQLFHFNTVAIGIQTILNSYEYCDSTMEVYSLMDTVIATLGVLLTMTMLSCLCCLCMKFSDLRMKICILETAKKKGFKVDLDQLHPKTTFQSSQANDSCTIVIPDVAIVL